MIEPSSLETLSHEIRDCVEAERSKLDELRADMRKLRGQVRRIHPHSTTAISLVGTDGGNNRLQFDPLMVQLIRVVDSSNNEYCLEAVTPRSNLDLVCARHVDAIGNPVTALGRMMNRLGVNSLSDLSVMIPSPPAEPKPSWVQVYRELTEWAVLLDLVCTKDFGTDTLIICDGFLRSKVFAGYLFKEYRQALDNAIAAQYERNRRRIFVAGVAKTSKVLQTYQLAMALEGVLRNSFPSFVAIPREIEAKVYTWSEYARGDEDVQGGGEGNRFVAGKMFFVKFGKSPYDPAWAIDLLDSQAEDASNILGYMLHDAVEGFPVPFYPMCLQRAHENAALVGFDMAILQDRILEALRISLGSRAHVIDEFGLQTTDPAAARYG